MTATFDATLLGDPAPQQPASNSSGWMQTGLIIAAIVAGFWFLNRNDGGNGGGDSDDPRPVVSVQEEAQFIATTFVASMAQDSEVLAKEIRDGKIDSLQGVVDSAKAKWKETHGKFIELTGKLDNDNVPQPFDASKAAKYYEEYAKGFRKAIKQ